MRCESSVFGRGLAVAVFAVATGFAMPAAAQGLLDGFFAIFAPKPKPKPSVPEWSGRPRVDQGAGSANPFDQARPAPSKFGSGRYRTMCVRLCDGYYFPISNAVSRRDFYQDADVCQARCTSEAQLFYMPTAAGSIEQARSLTGLAYEDLTNAFRYRKALVASCTCRPEPWSAVEHARHERYAMIEAGTLDPSQARLAERDGGLPETSLQDDGSGRPLAVPALVGGPLPDAPRPVAVRPSPRDLPGPSFGLGGPGGGGQSGAAPLRKKPSFRSHWPGMDGN